MGFLTDLGRLTTQANAAYARMDVGAQLDAASRAMTEAGRVLAATAPPAGSDDAWLEVARVRTTATVVDARQLPMMIGMHSVVELDLVVAMASGIPLPVTRTEQLAPLHLARVAPGARIDVSIVPGRPESVRLEWAA